MIEEPVPGMFGGERRSRVGEPVMRDRPEARLVAEANAPAYVRVEPAPRVGRSGLCISAYVQVSEPAGASGQPQVALAHAEHAAGWSLGVDPHGRASLVAGTASGPAVLRVGEPLHSGRWYELIARIPGVTSDRLELTVRPEGEPDASGSVRLGAPVVNADGPLLWGCRSLDADGRPELAFAGRVADVLIVADAEASGSRDDLSSDPRRAVRWPLDASVG